ncbi:hypothetical protein QNH36_03130 [Mesobacillus sp. AQ2]|uniref:hypothetical protein n=1 Tax=Mesobacillus sp. AQ2 TaxID=3043332 RepID=UPI0024C158C8|nr:hypothetical protein [Mesobacillus sp. AQ2]WHX41173.1 hypothetical protein QNH36_03130 [Mesobacillus sp. AQ2]
MEVLMNELSLEGQFSSINEFLTSLREMIVIQKIMDKAQIKLSKHYNLINEQVTETHTLHDVLTDNSVKTTNEIRRFKMYLKRLLSDPSFWHENQLHDHTNKYLCDYTNKTHDYSLAESCEREKKVLSFKHNKFLEDVLVINKNSTRVEILNFHNRYLLNEILFEEGLISEIDYCINHFDNSNLSFENLDQNFSFNILTHDEKKMFISSFRMFSEMSWDEILTHDGLKYKQYTPTGESWFLHTPYSDKKIYKFRTSQKCRCFGYRENDIFYALRFERDHKISDNG